MNHTAFAIMGLFSISLSGCGSKWMGSEAKFFKFQNHDVRVAAKVTLNEKARPNVSRKNGVEFGLRLYSGNFASVLTETTQQVGESLEASGTVNVPEVITIAISEFRLGGTPNSYTDFCAEIRMENSNLQDWKRIGCLNFNDTPSESPTGGVGVASLWADSL